MWKIKLKCNLLQLLILTILLVFSLPGWKLWVRTFRNEGQGSATYTQDVYLPHKISWASTWRLARFISVTQSLCKKEPHVGVVLQNKKNQYLCSVTRSRIQTWHLLAATTTTYLLPTTMPYKYFVSFFFELTKTSTSIWPTLHYFQPSGLLQTVFFFFFGLMQTSTGIWPSLQQRHTDAAQGISNLAWSKADCNIELYFTHCTNHLNCNSFCL